MYHLQAASASTPAQQQQQQQERHSDSIKAYLQHMQIFVLGRPDADFTSSGRCGGGSSRRSSTSSMFQGTRVVVSTHWRPQLLRQLLSDAEFALLRQLLQAPSPTATAPAAAAAAAPATAAPTAAATAGGGGAPAAAGGAAAAKAKKPAKAKQPKPQKAVRWVAPAQAEVYSQHESPLSVLGLQLRRWSVYDALQLRPWDAAEYLALGGAQSHGFLDMPVLLQQLVDAAKLGYGSSKMQLPSPVAALSSKSAASSSRKQQPGRVAASSSKSAASSTCTHCDGVLLGGVGVGKGVNALFEATHGVKQVMTMENERAVGQMGRVRSRHVSRMSRAAEDWKTKGSKAVFESQGVVTQEEYEAGRQQLKAQRAADRAVRDEHGCTYHAGFIGWVLQATAAGAQQASSRQVAVQVANQKALIKKWGRAQCEAAVSAALQEQRGPAAVLREAAQQALRGVAAATAAVAAATEQHGSAAHDLQEALVAATAKLREAELAADPAEQAVAALEECDKPRVLLKDLRATLTGLTPLSDSVRTAAEQAQTAPAQGNRKRRRSRQKGSSEQPSGTGTAAAAAKQQQQQGAAAADGQQQQQQLGGQRRSGRKQKVPLKHLDLLPADLLSDLETSESDADVQDATDSADSSADSDTQGEDSDLGSDAAVDEIESAGEADSSSDGGYDSDCAVASKKRC